MNNIKSLALITVFLGMAACSSGENPNLEQTSNSSVLEENNNNQNPQLNTFDLFHPIRVCQGVTCKLQPISAADRNDANIVASLYQNSDANFPQGLAAASFLKHLYISVYKRQPDELGFYFWLNEHFNNNASVPARPAHHLASAVIRATECTAYMNAQTNLSVTAEPFLNMLYPALLGRTPDTTGFNYWKNAMINGGETRDEVLDNFYLSSSFTEFVQSFGLAL